MIEHNAEKRVIQDLKELADRSPGHRCLYLRFSQTNLDKNMWLPALTQILKGRFFEEVAQIYICHDNDVFITGRSWTNKRLAEFLAHLSPQLSPVPLQGLASLFEVGVHWPSLRTLCLKKLENLEILKMKLSQKKKVELDLVSTQETIDTISKDLIHTLSARRGLRKDIEIMVVEDDSFSQKLVASALKSYNLTITGDGKGAIMTYVHKAPDILFLDIGLPDIDGHEVLEKLFKIDPKAYVVMFSGNGDKENVMKAIQLGAKGFVGKPFTKEKLHQYIQKSPFIHAKQKNKELV